MKKKNVFITGSSGMIGKAIIKELSYKYNFIPIKMTRKNDSQLPLPLPLPVGDIDNYGLINCVGSFQRKEITELTVAEFEEQLQTNLLLPFYYTQWILSKQGLSNNGRIINFGISDSNKITAKPQITPHYISKLGVVALTKAYAKKLANRGITVNCISPGVIETNNGVTEQIPNVIKGIPMKRKGEPQDIVNLVEFLLSEKSSYITGENIQVGGGLGM